MFAGNADGGPDFVVGGVVADDLTSIVAEVSLGLLPVMAYLLCELTFLQPYVEWGKVSQEWVVETWFGFHESPLAILPVYQE